MKKSIITTSILLIMPILLIGGEFGVNIRTGAGYWSGYTGFEAEPGIEYIYAKHLFGAGFEYSSYFASNSSITRYSITAAYRYNLFRYSLTENFGFNTFAGLSALLTLGSQVKNAGFASSTALLIPDIFLVLSAETKLKINTVSLPFSLHLKANLYKYTLSASLSYRKHITTPLNIEAEVVFSDENGDRYISPGEHGKIMVRIKNSSTDNIAKNTRIKLYIEEEYAKDVLKMDRAIPVGTIPPKGEKEGAADIKAKQILPADGFTLVALIEGTDEGGRKFTKKKRIPINIRAGTVINVNILGFTPRELPPCINPVDAEHADWFCEYYRGKLYITNAYTGDRVERSASTETEATYELIDFFKKMDKEYPQLLLSVEDGERIKGEAVNIKIRVSDDRSLGKLKIYKNDRLYATYAFSELAEAEESIDIPLKLGNNFLRFEITDWVGKEQRKDISLIRIKGEGIAYTGEVPETAPPPDLKVEITTGDGNNIIEGGKKEKLIVKIKNKGKGPAKWVRVNLSGDEYLVKSFGRKRDAGNIMPGEERIVEFERIFPPDIEQRGAELSIQVKEARGYSPMKKWTKYFTMVPKGVEVVVEERIEDVDYTVPKRKLKREKGYAVIVGLTKYQNLRGPKFARKDAEIFEKYAINVFGIPPGNIRLLTDEKATSSVIKGYLRDWLSRKEGFKVIYFAGHGVPDPENPRSGASYILPYDGNPELKTTLIGVEEIARYSRNNEKDTIIVILDACFSGVGGGRTPELAQRPLVVARIPSTGGIYLSAAEGSQPSKDYEKAKHGYFTYYLLLGLKGRADSNRDGWITTKELYDYVKSNVEEVTDGLQIPVLKPEKNIKIGRYR